MGKEYQELVEKSKKELPKGGKYDLIKEIYKEEDLDEAILFLIVTPEDKKLIKRVMDVIGREFGFSYNDLYELVFYAVMTSDPKDIEYLQNKGFALCEQCGWCCRTCNIEIVPRDIQRAGDPSAFEFVGGEEFKVKLPCKFLTEDNRCSIYADRPNSCRTFPLGIRRGTLVVQRSNECDLIFNFLVIKAKSFIAKAFNKRSKEHKGGMRNANR